MEIIKTSLGIIIEKSPIYSDRTHHWVNLSNFSTEDRELLAKSNLSISEYMNENNYYLQKMMMVENIILHKFRSDFVVFLRPLFLMQKDFEFLKWMFLSPLRLYCFRKSYTFAATQIELCRRLWI
jgi:hypothetical protein